MFRYLTVLEDTLSSKALLCSAAPRLVSVRQTRWNFLCVKPVDRQLQFVKAR